jgi:putative nucleotidyltransferase with HDIG domain
MLLATAAGLAFLGVNLGLLTIAMSLEEHRRPGAVWRERFRWVIPYGVAAGPLAYGLLVGYERFGPIAVLVFSLPPASMMLSVRQYLARTQQSLEDVRQANAALEHANTALAVRNEDLRELFEFAGGLATRAGSRFDLVRYVEDSLTRIAGATVRVDDARNMIEVRGEATAERWNRLSDLIVPQVATALERLELLEKVRRTHVATIAALSRSMEAKDGYTGGHTERVTAIAVALARRLGYAGEELDAIETGALMHDIGKIGIPERILHKPSALDDEEWAVMRKHPVISDYILSGIDLPAEVRQIVRSSHERIDGQGYPDGLAGAEIPLPARIVFVADAFDALTSDRPYRAARSTREALDEIRANAGTQFCPAVVAALEQVAREEPGLVGTPPPLRAVRVA